MKRTACFLLVAAACGLIHGCAGAGDLLNPNFLASAGLGQQSAILPGEAPAIVIEVENRIGRTVEFRVQWRDAEGRVQTRVNVLSPGDRLSEAAICPIEEMTLGQLADLDASGATVRLGSGDPEDPFIVVEPFGVLLQEGINYDCGDIVTFAVQGGATRSGFQTFAFIRRSGAQVEP